MIPEAVTRDKTPANTGKKGIKMIFGTENIPQRIRRKKPMPYKVVTHDVVENTDVCIIGSGAAGAILANKISRGIKEEKDENGVVIKEGIEGRNVVLIEKGGYYDPEDFNQRGDSMMKLLWKNGGIQFTRDLSCLIAQGECLGGSTTINDAVCYRTPPNVIKEWRDNFGVKIDDEKWKSAIDEVWDKLSVTRLTDDEIKKNKNALILKDACHQCDFHGQNNARNCKNCACCGTCHFGCHYETKQDMLNTYIYEALQPEKKDNPENEEAKMEKDLKIYCNCDVRKINYQEGVATGIEGKFLGQKGIEKFKLKVNASVIILAAGSIASSVLLLSNNIAYGKAGKGLAIHPSTTLIAKFNDKEIRASEGIPMAYCCDEFSVLNYDNNGKKKGGFMLESISPPIIQFSLMLPYHLQGKLPPGHPSTENLMNNFQNYATAGVMVRDDPIGRIELTKNGNPKICYALQENEIQNLVQGIEVLTKLFFVAGANEVITRHGTTHILKREGNINSQIKKLVEEVELQYSTDTLTGLGSAHPQGGNRMGDKPDTCVVDQDCKVYGFENLFVCDASVFPTSLGVNPQITVMAIATMAAENIIKNWIKFKNFDAKKHICDTCDKDNPRTCDLETLSIMFNQITNHGSLDDLVNLKKSNQRAWSFDKSSLMIKNKLHWRGFIPDPELPEEIHQFLDDTYFDWLGDYYEGFWKEFYKPEGEKLKGNLNIYFTEKNNDLKIIPKKIEHEIYGDVIKLTYPKLPMVYDYLKIINENNIIGKVFLSFPPLYPDLELVPFVMTKEYSAEWMDEYDHDNIIKEAGKSIELENILGYWSLRTVRNHLLSPVIEVFHFQKGEDWKIKNRYCSGDWVKKGDVIYSCKIDHTSGSSNEPGSKKNWADFWELAKKPTEILKETLLKELPWLDEGENIRWKNSSYKINENFLIGTLTSSPVDENIAVQSEHFQKISEGKKGYIIRYTLSTVAGSWIRDQD